MQIVKFILAMQIIIIHVFFNTVDSNCQIIVEFTNGGKDFEEVEYSDKKEFFRKLQHGETLVYWREESLGYLFGPSFANRVHTSVSDSVLTDFKYLAKKEMQTEIGTAEKTQSIETTKSLVSFRLEPTSRIDELLASIKNLGKSTQISWSKLQLLYAKAMLSQNYSNMDLLNYLLSNQIISHEEFLRIKKLLTDEKNFNVSVNLYNFLLFIKKFGLMHAIDISMLDRIVSTKTLESEKDVDMLDKVLDLETLIRDVKIGSPKIKLKKNVVLSIIPNLEYTINYNIKIKNTGGIAATDVIVIDCLPYGLKHLDTRIRGNLCKVKIKKVDEKEIVIWKLQNRMLRGDSCTIYFDTKILKKKLI